MANSTALAYRQWAAIDTSASGAGQQYLGQLWQLYHYFWTTADTVDTNRWRLVEDSGINWNAVGSVVDGSWFVVEAYKGRRQWQALFQATNVAALAEAPGIDYCLTVNLCSGGGWTAYGDPNGGFSASAVVCSGNLLLGGLDMSGVSGLASMITHGDRDTVLIAATADGVANWTQGAYVGRFEPDADQMAYPECVLTAWNSAGSPKGFDRTAGGVFSNVPSSSHVLSHALIPAAQAVQVWTAGWMDSSHQPSGFTSAYTYRPLEISSPDSFLGYLRMVWGCAGMTSNSRLDYRQKLVLHDTALSSGVCIQHNGQLPP